MEALLELAGLFFELLAEGAVEGATDRKRPGGVRWLCWTVVIALTAGLAALAVLFLALGITGRELVLAERMGCCLMALMIVGLLMASGYKINKRLRKSRQI